MGISTQGLLSKGPCWWNQCVHSRRSLLGRCRWWSWPWIPEKHDGNPIAVGEDAVGLFIFRLCSSILWWTLCQDVLERVTESEAPVRFIRCQLCCLVYDEVDESTSFTYDGKTSKCQTFETTASLSYLHRQNEKGWCNKYTLPASVWDLGPYLLFKNCRCSFFDVSSHPNLWWTIQQKNILQGQPSAATGWIPTVGSSKLVSTAVMSWRTVARISSTSHGPKAGKFPVESR